MFPLRLVAINLAAFLVAACSTTGPEMPENLDEALVDLETRTLQDARERDENVDAMLDEAEGYAIFSKRLTKVPLVGRAEGWGVAVDPRDNRRVPLRIVQVEAGGGLGDVNYRMLLLFSDRDRFERLRSGTVSFGAGMSAAGGESTEVASSSSARDWKEKGWATYLFADKGATATWTVRMIRFEPLEAD